MTEEREFRIEALVLALELLDMLDKTLSTCQ
jgi:hypothetical protein